MPATFFGKVGFLLSNYGMSYLRGAGTTLLIALVATFVGVIIGLLVGIVMTIPTQRGDGAAKKGILWIVKKILFIYIELFRGTPMMVQAMFIFYGALQYLNINMSMWFAAFFIVSINTGAYMSETVRGGILSIDKGQTEGAKAIGMTHFQTMLHVIMPQALRNIMPQIGNNLIINIKDTSVLSVISVTELFFVGKSVAGVYYTTFASFFIVSVMYLVMTNTSARILRYMEKRMDGADNYDLATEDTLAHTSGMTGYIEKKEQNHD